MVRSTVTAPAPSVQSDGVGGDSIAPVAGDSVAPAGGDSIAPENRDESDDDNDGESEESCTDDDDDPCLLTDIDSPDAHSPAPAPAATVGGDDSPVGEKIALVHPDGSVEVWEVDPKRESQIPDEKLPLVGKQIAKYPPPGFLVVFIFGPRMAHCEFCNSFAVFSWFMFVLILS